MRCDGYKKGVPDIAWWRRQIAAGVRFRKDFALEQRWNTWRSYYRGRWPINVLPVNLYFKMLRTVVPRIYFRNPSISVQATKVGLEQQVFAQLIERIDNKLIRTMGVKGQMKKMIHNAWMFGTGAGKLGFGAEFTPTPDEFETMAPAYSSAKLTRRVEWNSLVTPNMPWFMSVHTGNLIVPDGLMAFEEAPWVAMRIRRTVDDVKNDKRLSNTSGLKGGTTLASTENPSVGRRSPMTETNDIDLYEVRDMRTGKVIIFSASSGDEPLLFEDDLLQTNYRPNIYPLVFNPDDEVFWGIPDSMILEPQQLELNEVRTLQMKHRRISLIKLLVKRGAIDSTELEKLLGGDVGCAVFVNKDAEMTDFEKFELGNIPESLFAADQTIQGDVRDQMGFSRNQSGDYASQKSHNAPTAYEASVVNAAAEIRVDERRDGAADVLVSVFEDANVLCFEEWTDDQVQQVMGPDSIPYWVAFKPAMLKAARYEMNIDPDSSVPETKEIRRQKADLIYEKAKLNPLIDPLMLTKWYLREQGGVALDQMVRQVQQNAAAGLPGSSPDQPMGVEQFLGNMMNQPQGKSVH